MSKERCKEVEKSFKAMKTHWVFWWTYTQCLLTFEGQPVGDYFGIWQTYVNDFAVDGFWMLG